jgi:flagellar biosynthesis/type III secretory pathway protein FliH
VETYRFCALRRAAAKLAGPGRTVEWETDDRAKVAERDARGALTVARDEGELKGKVEGLAEGKREGLAEGKRDALLRLLARSELVLAASRAPRG